nr:uncharacterized protein LOC123280619 isoform X2 [Equus asinus]
MRERSQAPGVQEQAWLDKRCHVCTRDTKRRTSAAEAEATSHPMPRRTLQLVDKDSHQLSTHCDLSLQDSNGPTENAAQTEKKKVQNSRRSEMKKRMKQRLVS